MQPSLIDSRVRTALEPPRQNRSRAAHHTRSALPGVSRTKARSTAPRARARARSAIVGHDILWVVVASVVLSAMLELAQVSLNAALGGAVEPAAIAVDTIRKLSWGIFVCVALWLGIVLGGARPHLVAVVGLVAAPSASLFAHFMAIAAQGFASASGPLSPYAVAGLRGIEYAVLALVLLRLPTRSARAQLYYAIGALMVGLAFGGLLLALTSRLAANPLPPSALIVAAVNELLFPVGCALIMFRASRVPG
jgi:hypothetical protein